jgi:AcrR family transcriptional regulator
VDRAIEDAAIELLETRGYNELSLAAVAELAGTTTAAIYRRYGSKSELVARVVFRTDGDDVVAETGDLAADLETMIRWSVEKLSRPAALAAILGLLGAPKHARVDRAADAAGASMLVVGRLERAKALGELRSDVDTRVLAAMIDGPVLHAVLGGMADPIDDAWISGLVSILLRGAATQSDTTNEQRRKVTSP